MYDLPLPLFSMPNVTTVQKVRISCAYFSFKVRAQFARLYQIQSLILVLAKFSKLELVIKPTF